jgi:hypothetical protein
MIEVTRRRTFWQLTLNDILVVLCAAAVPIAIGIYTVVIYQQEQDQLDQTREFNLKQTIDMRRDTIYDKFLHNIYNLDKNGYLNESEDPWAFANAYYRAVHRHLDPIRKAEVLQFLKEKKLIGKSDCITGCKSKKMVDIIRLNELSFDNVHVTSQTGYLNRLNLDCVVFDDVSMTNATFLYTNLNGVSFDHTRLENANFYDVSLVCASFNGTDLSGTDFGNSDLTDAQFWHANLSTARLTEGQLKQAKFFYTTMPDGTMSQTKQQQVRYPLNF